MPNLEEAPSWFLRIAVVAMCSCLPLILVTERRLTVVEAKQEALEGSNHRLILVLDRLDESVDALNATTASLKVEIRNIKER